MRISTLFFLLLMMLIMPSAIAEATPKAVKFYVGQQIDDLDFTTTDGTAYTLGDVKAPVVLLHYWASWCPPCVVEFPHLIDTVREMGGQVAVIAISLDYKQDAMQRYIDTLAADSLPIYWVQDPSYELAIRRFRISGTPETVFLGPDRSVLKVVNDQYDWRTHESWKELTAMISGSI